jgi:hypothetical protein
MMYLIDVYMKLQHARAEIIHNDNAKKNRPQSLFFDEFLRSLSRIRFFS